MVGRGRLSGRASRARGVRRHRGLRPRFGELEVSGGIAFGRSACGFMGMIARKSTAGHPPRLAKLTRPQLSGAVPRPRLFKILDEATTKPLIWIYGPPGAG